LYKGVNATSAISFSFLPERKNTARQRQVKYRSRQAAAERTRMSRKLLLLLPTCELPSAREAREKKRGCLIDFLSIITYYCSVSPIQSVFQYYYI